VPREVVVHEKDQIVKSDQMVHNQGHIDHRWVALEQAAHKWVVHMLGEDVVHKQIVLRELVVEPDQE